MSMQNLPEYSQKELAKAGFTSADRILTSWGCTEQQSQIILGLSQSNYQDLKLFPNDIELSIEQFERVSHLLNIHQTLRVLFRNSENVCGFMSMKNNNPYFCQRSPLEIIVSGKFEDLREVAYQVNSMIDTSARIGIAKNSFSVPDDIDINNEAITSLVHRSDF